MARSISIKQRGATKRKVKKAFLFITEGKNKTETLYFSHYQKHGKDYAITFVKAGSNTDAKSMYKTIAQRWDDEKLDFETGDMAFIVLDIDNDKQKSDKVYRLIKDNRNPGIVFIVSNPTFEIWFLLHDKYTTKYFDDGDAVIKDLKRFIPSYEKNRDVYDLIEDKIETALDNSSKLEKYFADDKWPDCICNPRTDIGMLVGQYLK